MGHGPFLGICLNVLKRKNANKTLSYLFMYNSCNAKVW